LVGVSMYTDAASTVVSINPESVTLERGGQQIALTVTVNDVSHFDNVLVTHGGLSNGAVTARLQRIPPAALSIVLSAHANAAPGNDYRIQLVATDVPIPIKLPTVVTVVADVAPARPTRAQASGQQVPQALPGQVATTLAQEPEPNITNWGPRSRAPMNGTVFFEGTGLKPEQFHAVLGAGSHVVPLQITLGAPNRIEARIPASAQTGQDVSVPLTVYYTGGKSRILDPAYQVVDSTARFKGPSFWHFPATTNDTIFTQGDVLLELVNLDFAATGTGSYRETVSLILPTRAYSESCKDTLNVDGKRAVQEYGPTRISLTRPIEWAKVANGRVELKGIGVFNADSEQGKVNTIASVDATSLRATFLAFALNTTAFKDTGDCKSLVGDVAEDAGKIAFVGMGGALFYQHAFDTQLIAVPRAFVEFAVQRL
jgi:hypothetical protein